MIKPTKTLSEVERDQLHEMRVDSSEKRSELGVDLDNAFTAAIKKASADAEVHRVEAIAQAAREEAETAARVAAEAGNGARGAIIADRAKGRAASAYINTQRALVTRLAADLVPHAMLQLAAIAANPLEVGSVRVAAIEKIADRAVGKATTPLRVAEKDLYKMPVLEALTLLGEMASDGSMTAEEVNTHQRVLETRVKALEVEQLTQRMDALEAQLTGRGPSSAAGSSAMN